MNKITVALIIAVICLGCSRRASDTDQKIEPTEGQAGLIEMGAEAQKHVGLEVVSAKVKQLTEMLQVTGTVQPIDSRLGRVRTLANGRIQEVLVTAGDRVVAGQPLARFDNIDAGDLSSQYQSAQADLRKLQAQHSNAFKQLERNQHLVEIGAVPQKELESSQSEEQALEASQKAQESIIAGLTARLRRFGVVDGNSQNSSLTTIRSPFAGVVVKVAAAPGEAVDPSSELFEIADLSRVWVQAEVYEKDLGHIRVGQTALISVDTYPDQKFSGKMTYISDVLDAQTRTVKVRCEVPNPGIKLKLDMFASVSLPTMFSKRALAVPTSAIQQVETKTVVFVQKAPTKFEAREVKIGQTVDGNTEVLSGLHDGEPVVKTGAFHLKSIVLGGTIGEED
jgi:cobalt-zinc-cadmium efflux system membrane fusion protein